MTTLHLLAIELQKQESRTCRCCGRLMEEGDRGFVPTEPIGMTGTYCRVSCAEEAHRSHARIVRAEN